MKCTFCKGELPPVGGILYVRKDGGKLHFCSSKCKKSFFMGRNPRKKKWVRKQKD